MWRVIQRLTRTALTKNDHSLDDLELNEPQYGFGHCGSFLLRYLATALPSRQVALPLRLRSP